MNQNTAKLRSNVFSILCFLIISFLIYYIGFSLFPPKTYPSFKKFKGISYTPFQSYSTYRPSNLNFKLSPQKIERDLQQIARLTDCIRIYSTQYDLDKVPPIAAKYGLKVIAGAYLYDDEKLTKKELDKLIFVANKYKNITKVIVGNEVTYHRLLKKNHISLNKQIEAIRYVKARIKQPVSTAEPYYIWLKAPKLADDVDFITIHLLPYWFNVNIFGSTPWVWTNYDQIKDRFPDKGILIGETGWPSSGPSRAGSVPSLENTYTFINEFQTAASVTDWDYVLFEAFDQPWRINLLEGRVAAHWGLFYANGSPKFQNIGSGKDMVVQSPVGDFLGFYFVLAGLFYVIFYFTLRQINFSAKILMAFLAHILAFPFAWMLTEIKEIYIFQNILYLQLFIPTTLILIILVLYKVQQMLEVIGKKPLNTLNSKLKSDAVPFVSVHVPCSNEDPNMVINTLRSLLNLDYENYEIICIDNNTKVESLWKPVENFCQEHKEKIKFVHIEKLGGYKAGALKLALDYTSPRAEIIGIIDSDYIVDQKWLKTCVPYFYDPTIGSVQAPQDYIENYNTLFERSIYDEYIGFFRIGMRQRNEYNAIIQHGTMLLISRDALIKSGSWQLDTIVEDTDLGLRLLINGYKCIYVDEVLGRGILPKSFNEYRKQRFRWVFGAFRTTVKYFKEFFLPKSKLKQSQKLHFMLGWLNWYVLIFLILFIFFASVNSFLMIAVTPNYLQHYFFQIPISVFILVEIITTIVNYRVRVKISYARIFYSMLASAALIWTIALASLRGIFTKKYPFLVTGKQKSKTYLFSKPIIIPLILSTTCLLLGIYVALSCSYLNSEYILWGLMNIILAFPATKVLVMALFEKLKINRSDSKVKMKTNSNC